MSLIKRNNCRNYFYSFYFNGKKYFGSTKTSNKSKAAQYETKLKNQVYNNQMLDEGEEITLEKALEKYYLHVRDEPQGKLIDTFRRKICGWMYDKRRENIIECARLADKETLIHKIESKNIFNLIEGRKLEKTSQAWINNEMSCIRGMFEYMKKLGYKVNPKLEYPKMKAGKRRLRYLTVEEESKLLKELDPHLITKPRRGVSTWENMNPRMKSILQDNYDFTVLLLDTGMRHTELSHLELKQVDLKNKCIHVWRNKVKNESVLGMTDRVFEIFKRRFETVPNNKYVFEHESGDPRSYNEKGFKNAVRRAGLENVTFHTLRHSYASRLVQNGMSIYGVSKLLGHSSVKMTERYSHLSPNDASATAVELLNRVNKKEG